MNAAKRSLEPARLLLDHYHLFFESPPPGPILDLACGNGQNGIFIAQKELPVICCDKSERALERAKKLASRNSVTATFWHVDLEQQGGNPLHEHFYRGMLVFRYLHRPLMPCIKKAIKNGGLLIYETFTIDQIKYGKPHNPDFLLKPGELKTCFEDWEVIFSFEGFMDNPPRAIAQLVARKPGDRGSGSKTPVP